ncbi:MAG: DEAD/DEAH box helicase family protein [Oscillospiraceae bacterium]|nr:DEAD/DEAH box helicase family protein [Oscillospiraceae bacterium]
MSIELFEHNKTAYESAVAMLAKTGKAAVIHPTGTGKSFIGFRLCEDNPDKTVCWISPSRYIFKTQIENLKAAGCDVPENIVFFTYKKLTLLSDDEINAIKPDYIIIDEYHRGGAFTWNDALNRLIEKYPNVPMLGLSATNIRYLDNQRDMADELFDGNIASEMTLGEAVVRGILAPPKYIMSVFSYRDDLERYEKRISRAHNKKCVIPLRNTLKSFSGLLKKPTDLMRFF